MLCLKDAYEVRILVAVGRYVVQRRASEMRTEIICLKDLYF